MLKLERRALIAVGVLGFVPVLRAQESSSTPPFIIYPAPVTDVAEKTQKPICSVAEAVAAYAQGSAENVNFLTLARTQCEEALRLLKEIISNESLAAEEIRQYVRYLEGISELIEQEVSVNTVGEYATTMQDVVTEARDIIDKIIDDPKSVEDSEVVKLFKNFAAVNLLNAGMFGMPAG